MGNAICVFPSQHQVNVKIFHVKLEGIRFLTCASPETGAVTQRVKKSCQQLLIVNLQDNTGICHYVIFVRKTSVVGRNKRS